MPLGARAEAEEEWKPRREASWTAGAADLQDDGEAVTRCRAGAAPPSLETRPKNCASLYTQSHLLQPPCIVARDPSSAKAVARRSAMPLLAQRHRLKVLSDSELQFSAAFIVQQTATNITITCFKGWSIVGALTCCTDSLAIPHGDCAEITSAVGCPAPTKRLPLLATLDRYIFDAIPILCVQCAIFSRYYDLGMRKRMRCFFLRLSVSLARLPREHHVMLYIATHPPCNPNLQQKHTIASMERSVHVSLVSWLRARTRANPKPIFIADPHP